MMPMVPKSATLHSLGQDNLSKVQHFCHVMPLASVLELDDATGIGVAVM